MAPKNRTSIAKTRKELITNKNLTEMFFILDRSEPMSSLLSDTIGGYNRLIEKHKKEQDEAAVTANIWIPPDVLLQWQTAFTHRRCYLFADPSNFHGTQPAQIERCTMEGRLTDFTTSEMLLEKNARPLPYHFST